MHVHALNIICTPPLHSNLKVWQFLFPLCLVWIVVSGLRYFHWCLIILRPLLHNGIVFQFFTPSWDNPSWVFHWKHVLRLGYNILKYNVKRWLEICFLIWPPSLLKTLLTLSLPGAPVIFIKTFLHPVLYVFHNFLRILSNVNFMNGRIGEVIVSLPA